MGIGRRLKAARKERRWTQVSLAAHAKVGLVSIRRVEQEGFEPRLATARKLADAVGVRVEWLVFGIGPMTDEGTGEDG